MFSNQIRKTVLDKQSGQRVIQRDFTTFTQPVEDVEGSIEQFFNEYERLFFDIPIEGEVQSHQALVRRSSEYSGFEKDTEEVDSLLEELEALRQQNLDLEQTIVDLEIQLEGRVSPTSFDKQAEILKQQNV
jgi:hypothetical protein